MPELMELGKNGYVISRGRVGGNRIDGAMIAGGRCSWGVVQPFAIHLGEVLDKLRIGLLGRWEQAPFATAFREKASLLDEIVAMASELRVGNGFAAVGSKTSAVGKLLE